MERVFVAHFTADLRSLAAGRIALASVLLLDLVGRACELRLWYTNDGIIPNHTLLWRPAWDHVFSLFYLASYTHEAVAGVAICAVAYTCLLIGFRTRLAQVASLVCLISLHGRLLLFDNGGDVALGLLCIWTTFLPTGARFSVDAVLTRARADAGLTPEPDERNPFVAEPGKPRAVSFGVLALTWQLALIYLFNAIHKQGSTWREGSAVHYVLHLDRLATPLAVWLRELMTPDLSRALTWSALALEWSLPVLLLSPFGVRGCRRLAILFVVMLHSGFGLFMRLGIFVPAMIAFTPNFLPRQRLGCAGALVGAGEKPGATGCAPPRRGARRRSSGSPARSPRGERSWSLRRAPPRGRCSAGCPSPASWRWWASSSSPRISCSTRTAPLTAASINHNAPPVAAAVSYMNLFQGWSMFAPDAPMQRLQCRGRRDDRGRPPCRSVQRGRHARASPSRAHHPAGPRAELAVLRLREPPAQPPRLLPGPEGVDPPLPGPHRAAPRTRSSRSRCSSSRTTARRSGSGSPRTCARRSCSLTR